jgi:hypothetical protein
MVSCPLILKAGDKAVVEVLDLKEFELPLLDEPVPALVAMPEITEL